MHRESETPRNTWTCPMRWNSIVATSASATMCLLLLLSISAERSWAQENSELKSPRLRALAAELEGGNAQALHDFWQEMEAGTTPLIEPIEDDPNHVWLTMLWRGDEETHNVLLVRGLFRGFPAKHRLDELFETDLWFRTYRARTDLRGTYQFSPNDPRAVAVTVDREVVQALQKNSRRDPLNPKTFLGSSLIELSGAPSQPWIKENPEAAKGEVTVEKEFKSEILNNHRQISVYLPPGYDPSASPYPMLLVFDGSSYLTLVPTPRILNNLIHAGRISPIVAVFVGNVRGARVTELACNENFAEFLATELIPWVKEKYNVSADPAKNLVGGLSAGGLAASYVAFRHPEMFGNVISQSGSYWWSPDRIPDLLSLEVEDEWLTRQYAEADPKPIRFFLEVGLKEEGARPSMVVVNRHFRNVLLARGYEIVRYNEFNGRHEFINWRGSFADALIALIGK